MSNQHIKFFQASKLSNVSIDDQINDYLMNNPELKLSQITLAAGDNSCGTQALVLFDKVKLNYKIESGVKLPIAVKRHIVNTLSTYLERNENWIRLKESWLIDGESEELRKLLSEALSEL